MSFLKDIASKVANKIGWNSQAKKAPAKQGSTSSQSSAPLIAKHLAPKPQKEVKPQQITWELQSQKPEKKTFAAKAELKKTSQKNEALAEAKPSQKVKRTTIILKSGAQIAGSSSLKKVKDNTFTDNGKMYNVVSKLAENGERITKIEEASTTPNQNKKSVYFQKKKGASGTLVKDQAQQKKLEQILTDKTILVKNPTQEQNRDQSLTAQNSLVNKPETKHTQLTSTSLTSQWPEAKDLNKVKNIASIPETNPKYRVEQTDGNGTCAIFAAANGGKTKGIAPKINYRLSPDKKNVTVMWPDGHESVISADKLKNMNTQQRIEVAYLQRFPEAQIRSKPTEVLEKIYNKPAAFVDAANFKSDQVQKALRDPRTVAILGGEATDLDGTNPGMHGYSLIPNKNGTWTILNSNATVGKTKADSIAGTPLVGFKNTSKPVTVISQAELERIMKNEKSFISYVNVPQSGT